MVKAVIIDDEKKSRQALISLLERYCHSVIILGEAEGVRSGVDLIKSTEPDVIFLDIQMQDGSGFRLLQYFDEINFEIVFTTAFDQYAIKAIKFSALDYLLKPIVPQELMDAVRKVEDIKIARQQNISKNIDVLLENIQNPAESRKIILSTAEKIHVVDVDDIIRCESDNYYTNFFFKDGTKLLISKTLKENEYLLRGHQFIRSHKSHLINTKYIKGFLKGDGGFILMSDKSKVPVSRRRKELIMETLNNL
ncbi:MAG TPA: LytTR family DNA-binding domain-containing protein [Bacteroidales bacterium]|nr:LytTR family DNA-binding domain-containing protein [Bacteroidales bacterium]